MQVFANKDEECAYVASLLVRLRSGTRKPQYTLERLRQMWSVPSRGSFVTLPRENHLARQEDLPVLEPWLRDASPTLRHRAVLALTEARGVETQSTARLMTALDDEHALVRIAAIDGLRARPVENLGKIRCLLDDPVWRVRWHASHVLLRAGKPVGIAQVLADSAPRRWGTGWFDAVSQLAEPNEAIVQVLRERRSRTRDPWIQSFGAQIDNCLARLDEPMPPT